MSRLIDADALEKDGWMMHRTVQTDRNTMLYETKKPTDFPVIEPERKTGRWIRISKVTAKCSVCADYIDNAIVCGYNYCPNCGADMLEGEPMNNEESL